MNKHLVFCTVSRCEETYFEFLVQLKVKISQKYSSQYKVRAMFPKNNYIPILTSLDFRGECRKLPK